MGDGNATRSANGGNIMTFAEISQPYLKQFGKPDNIFEINLEGKNFTQWYWYGPDVIVEFSCPEDDQDGWELSFALSLDPLKYFKKKPEEE